MGEGGEAREQGVSQQSETDSKESGRKAGKRRRQKDEAGIAFMLMLMASFGIAEGVVAGFLTGQVMDQILVLAFVGILYYTALLAGMELCRRQRGWFYEKAGNYRQIAFWHGLTCAGALGMLFLPEFARPLLVLSMGMAIISNSFLGMLFGLFHGMVYALCGQGDIYSFLCSILLAAGGCLAAYLLEARENLPWKAVFLYLCGCAPFLLPCA